MLDVDGRDRIALVAEIDDGTPIGIVRVARDRGSVGEAEIAVATPGTAAGWGGCSSPQWPSGRGPSGSGG